MKGLELVAAGGPWAMKEAQFRAVLCEASSRIDAVKSGAFTPPESPDPEEGGEILVIPVRGPLQRHRNLFSLVSGSSNYAQLIEWIQQAAAEPNVQAIILEVDSPGGDAIGLAALVDLIYEVRAVKPIGTAVTGVGASAAYAIASAASKVYVAKEAILGSIGAVLRILDFSKMDARIGIEEIKIVSSQSPKKQPDPKDPEGLAQIQRELDAIAQVLIDGVARNRGVSAERVIADFGAGDVFVGQAAVDAGLADRVGNLEELARALTGQAPPTPIGSDHTESRGRPVAASEQGTAPASDSSSNTPVSTWEQIAEVAWKVTRQHGRERREAWAAEDKRLGIDLPVMHTVDPGCAAYLGLLKAEGVEPAEAERLIAGDSGLASRLQIPTLGQALDRTRAERVQHMSDIIADEAETEFPDAGDGRDFDASLPDMIRSATDPAAAGGGLGPRRSS